MPQLCALHHDTVIAQGSHALQFSEKLRHPLELVDVIRTGISREPHDLESTRLHFTQLLHATRTPAQHGGSPQPQRLHQVIGRLRGARKAAGKDLGVRDEKPLLPASHPFHK